MLSINFQKHLARLAPTTSANVELVLLPSKLLETDYTLQSAENRSWRFQAYLSMVPNIVKMCLWLFLPFLLLSLFYSVSSSIENYGLASLLHFTLIYSIAKLSAFALIFSVTVGLLASTIYTLPNIRSPLPSKIFLSEEGFAPWEPSCLIPWKNIRSVATRQLVYKGMFRSTVLEIDAQYQNQSVFKRVERLLKVDGLRRTIHYFDPVRNRIPEDKGSAKNYIRLPLEMFAFENDKQKFLAALREHIEPEYFNCDIDLVSDLDVISADSFTQLWLTDLRGVGNTTAPRVMEVGHELKNGKYEITGVLGFGSYSVVYAAKTTETGTTNDGAAVVAIKELVLNSGGTRASKEAILKHVLTEVEILRKIDHPNIVKCLDFFVENGKIYVVLEGIIASNLRELITQTGKWNEQSIIHATLECCSILEYLHGRPKPIIHRDFTPDNLIVVPKTNSIKLIDFNVAEEANASSSQTIVGKQSYMAPEQWCGQFTPSGDLYQLGCTMYFLATASEPEPLTQTNLDASSGLSVGLCSVIRKLTEREPADRYLSASELAEDIRKLDHEHPDKSHSIDQSPTI